MTLTELLDKYGYPTRNKSEDEMIEILDNCLAFNKHFLDEAVLAKQIKELGTDDLTDSQIEGINLVIGDHKEEPIASKKELFSLLNEWGEKVNLNEKNMLDSEFWEGLSRITSRYELPQPFENNKSYLSILIRDLAKTISELKFQLTREKEARENKVKEVKKFLYFISESLDHQNLYHKERDGILKHLKSKIERFDYILDSLRHETEPYDF